jgi:ComF family protein
MLAALFHSCVDLVFPPLEFGEAMPEPIHRPCCEQCGEMYPGELTTRYVCTNCAERNWALAWARAAYPMRGPVRHAILANKYQGEFHYLRPMTDWLEEGFRRHAAVEQWDALVSVPLYPVRQRERGFNQSHELARALGRRQGIPVWSCLRRIRPTSQQASLARSGRLRNLQGAFALKSTFDVSNKHLLIIDDVFTTGATAEACARVLMQNRASRVAVLTVARA